VFTAHNDEQGPITRIEDARHTFYSQLGHKHPFYLHDGGAVEGIVNLTSVPLAHITCIFTPAHHKRKRCLRVPSAYRHEAGVHRVQRVPATESMGRVHTSTASVVVLPDASQVGGVGRALRDMRHQTHACMALPLQRWCSKMRAR